MNYKNKRQFKGLRLMSAMIALFICSQTFGEVKRYIVTVDSPQVFRTLSAKAKGFNTFGALAQRGGAFQFLNNNSNKISQTFDNLGMIVVETTNPAEVEVLKSSQGLHVEEEIIIPAPAPVATFGSTNGRQTLGGPIPRPWGIDAVHAPEAWNSSNYGDGVRVLVLDTGIERDHPALKSRFEKGRNFMERDDNPPYEYYDVNGHGTHVAGTIAADGAQGGLVGVAPKARVLSARVCSSGCSSIAIIAGVDWGISEQVDVMNLSLGGPFPSTAARKAYERAELANIVVVAASGNDGVERISYPAAYPTTFAVGAVDSKLEKAGFSQWGPQLDIVAPGVDVLSSVPQGTGRAATVEVMIDKSQSEVSSSPMVGSGTGIVEGDVVFAQLGKPEDFLNLNLTGKIALIQRGEIPFADKAKNALAAGAKGVVIFNHEDGPLNGTLGEGVNMTEVVIGIPKIDGEKVLSAINAGQQVVLKASVEESDYAELQGTSMATPHVTGVAALVRAANPNLNPAEVRNILKSTATQLSGDNSANQLGSGLVNAEAAVEKALTPSLLLTGTF